MFALGVWDRRERKLWLVRDRMGEKPLYYGWIGEQFAFASELKAFRAAFGSELNINGRVLSEYLRAGYIAAPHSIYEGVFKLGAGHLVCLDCNTPTCALPAPVAYWKLEDVLSTHDNRSAPLDERTVVEEADAVLRQAVSERMVSDVPLGAFLSGGIDSSLVVSMMARESRKPVQTFTIGFDDQRYNELQYARKVGQSIGNVEHTELVITPADALQLIPTLNSLFDEPLADPSQIPTCFLAKLARQHVTVALSGDGADAARVAFVVAHAGTNASHALARNREDSGSRLGWTVAHDAAVALFPTAARRRSDAQACVHAAGAEPP